MTLLLFHVLVEEFLERRAGLEIRHLLLAALVVDLLGGGDVHHRGLHPGDEIGKAGALGHGRHGDRRVAVVGGNRAGRQEAAAADSNRSEEHTSELQSLMRISYAVFCLKKKTKNLQKTQNDININLN